MMDSQVQHSGDRATLGDIQSYGFFCEHCWNHNTLYVLSGADKFKCMSCGKKSAMITAVDKQISTPFGLSNLNVWMGLTTPLAIQMQTQMQRQSSLADIERTTLRVLGINIKNISSTPTSIILFRAEKNKSPNFGLPSNIEISVEDQVYNNILSGVEEIVIDGFRMKASNDMQLNNQILIKTPNNRIEQILPHNYIGPYSFSIDMFEVFPFSIHADGNSEFLFSLMGNTTVGLEFYIKSIKRK